MRRSISSKVKKQKYIMLVTLLLLSTACLSSNAFATNDSFPGLPPDCWPEPRIVHGEYIDQPLLQENMTLDKIIADVDMDSRIYSPNKGYWYSRQGVRPEVAFVISAEKDEAVELSFKNVHGISNDKWINEKLLFFRVWWGRLMMTDVIFDVEQERVVYSEAGMDGFMAYQQFQESCRQLGGCECIDRKEPRELHHAD